MKNRNPMFPMQMIALLFCVFNFACTIKAIPLTSTRYVDLTHVYDDSIQVFPGGRNFKIEQLINGTSEAFGVWLQAEIYSQTSHTGTHMDAPSHWIPGGINIDEMPLSQFFGPAAVIDISQKTLTDPDAEATIEDLIEWESGTGQTLNGSIVLLRTGWERKWNDRAAYLGTSDEDRNNIHYPGMSGAACRWLAENRTIKGVGCDTMSLDRGLSFITNDFPCHHALLPNGIFILESVAVKDELPLYGAFLHALPQKIGKGSGAPTRIIASVPEIVQSLP